VVLVLFKKVFAVSFEVQNVKKTYQILSRRYIIYLKTIHLEKLNVSK